MVVYKSVRFAEEPLVLKEIVLFLLSLSSKMVEVNCIGQKCPMPLITTKKALIGNPNDILCILLDNETSCSNLKTYLTDNGLEFSVEKVNGVFRIVTGNSIVQIESLGNEENYCNSNLERSYIVVLDSNEMGQGSMELGTILLKGFLSALSESDFLPAEVICYNKGVLLASSNTPFAGYLKVLEDKNVKITLCGTCVDYFGIKDELQAGKISNMMYILERLSSSFKIVKP